MELLSEVNQYVDQNLGKVKADYRQAYHMMAPIGWINDPNGFVQYKGVYHLFCQYHPYSAQWGPMHWGHWTSLDLVHWKWQGVALAPDTEADCCGCFSGTAIVHDGTLYLMYTGVSRDKTSELLIQQQCLAYSTDGMVFQKYEHNPVIASNQLPAGASCVDFRDPRLIIANGGYCALIASSRQNEGEILLYKSNDLMHWEYGGVFLKGIHCIAECPDYFVLNGEKMLMFSSTAKPDDKCIYPHDRPVVLLQGEQEPGMVEFKVKRHFVLDYGVDFYAPESLQLDDGRTILIGWMQNWLRHMPTEYLAHEWNGCMSLPRELIWENNTLYQRPIEEIKKMRSEGTTIHIQENQTVHLDLPVSAEVQIQLTGVKEHPCYIHFFESDDSALKVIVDPLTETICTDYAHAGYSVMLDPQNDAGNTVAPIHLREGTIELLVFLDVCSAEIFVNQGEQVISTRVFPRTPRKQHMSISGTALSGTIKYYRIGGK